MNPNPLVVQADDSTAWHTGLGLAGDAADIVNGIRDNSWVDPILGGVGASLDTLALAIDPIGGLVAWGVAWLMEHVQPLKDALDWLAGNADEITAHAATWTNVSAFTEQARLEYVTRLSSEVSAWFGTAADAYRTHASHHLEVLEGLAEASRGISYAVEGAGLLVALVRGIVRDLIAEFIATLAVRLPQWLAMEGLTLGMATPAVAAQVSALVLKWANRIQHFVRGLLSSLRRLHLKLTDLTGWFQQLKQATRQMWAPENPVPEARSHQTGGEVRPPRNILDYEARWADDAYDSIRSSDAELPAIVRATEAHGFTRDDIVRIKNHVFREEHLLDSYSDGEMARFDANPRIAEAWQRLSRGEPHPTDLDLLRHERYEAEFMARTGDPSYRRAHAATLEAGFTWEPEAAAADGFGYQRKS